MSTGDNVSSRTGGCGGNYAGRNAISALRKEDDTEEEHVLLQKEKKMEGSRVGLKVSLAVYLLLCRQGELWGDLIKKEWSCDT